MEEDIFPDRPTIKLYTENSIRVATFLGGPLVAGFLIADNFRQLGETKKVQVTWLVTIPVTILIFAIAFYLPEKTPPFLIPIAYTLITFYIAQNLQGSKIKAHVAAGGQTWSMGRAVLVGLAGLAIIVGIVFAAFLLMDRPLLK